MPATEHHDVRPEEDTQRGQEQPDVSRVGLVSDIHANVVALEAVLRDMPDVDALVHAGDVVGYGPSPNECIELLREQEAYSVRGNHDEGLFGGPIYESGDEYARKTVTNENRDWLEQCPEELTLFDGCLKIVHGHPEERFQYTYPSDFDADLIGDENILVLGHTHKQGKENFETGMVVNPGSVGQPRDFDERAAYAVADLSACQVSLKRVSYDIDRVMSRIQDSPVAAHNAKRLESGK